MICLAYNDDGVLVEMTGHPWGNPCVRRRVKPTLEERKAIWDHLIKPATLSHRERRQLARHGRRFPIRVPVLRSHPPLYCSVEQLVGHYMVIRSPSSNPQRFIMYIRDDESIDDPRHEKAFAAYAGQRLTANIESAPRCLDPSANG